MSTPITLYLHSLSFAVSYALIPSNLSMVQLNRDSDGVLTGRLRHNAVAYSIYPILFKDEVIHICSLKRQPSENLEKDFKQMRANKHLGQ